jgi:hypothetical protein
MSDREMTAVREPDRESTALGDAASDFVVRDATQSDNADLIDLAAACVMKGDIALRIDRGPDFFALNRLEGEKWRVGVAEVGGRVVGCIGISERKAYVNGSPMRVGYVGDLKVHPRHRNTRIADGLSHHAERVCSDLPPTAPLLIKVLAGNRSMERRLPGPRGVPAFTRIGTIRTHSIPVLGPRRPVAAGTMRIDTARWSDLDAMARLWNVIAPERQLASVLSADDFAEFIASAPGLDISSYLVARSQHGEMLGFLAAWDQRSFKQLTVVGYSPRVRVARLAFNAAAMALKARRLPRAGAQLDCATIAHLCVPSARPELLRALVFAAYSAVRSRDCSVLNIGLDVRDPLAPALQGMYAQPTDVHAYVVTIRRGVWPVVLDTRPLHYEIALV